jgi:predicted transcriptional regulator of viral defense system
MASNALDLKKIKSVGFLTATQIQKHLGVSQPTLSRLVKEGRVRRVSHGLYVHPDFEVPSHEVDFAVACVRFGPKSAIGGLSALFHYGLIDQAPSQIWVITPPEKSDHNRLYRTLRTKTSPREGIDSFEYYRMTSVERTLIEALRFSTKIGARVAINAARRAIKQGLTTEKKLGEMARKLKLQFVVKNYWEAIVS